LVAVSSAAATALIALVSPVLARVLQPSGRGELAAAQTVLALSPVFIAFGTKDSAGWAAIRGHYGRAVTGDVVRKIRGRITGMATAFACAGLVALVISRTYQALGLTLVILAVVSYVHVRAEITLGQWAALGDARRMSVYFFTPALCQVLIMVGLVLVGRLNPLSATAAMLAGYGLGILLRLVGAPGSSIEMHDTATAAAITHEGLAWWPGLLGVVCLSRLDLIFLTLVGNSEVLGLYAVASTAGLITQPLLPALQSRVLRAARAADRVLYFALHRTLMVYFGVALAAVAAAGWVLTPIVFGEAYLDSRPIFVVLCGSALANLSLNLTSQGLGAVGRGTDARRLTLHTLALGPPLLVAGVIAVPAHVLGTYTAGCMLLLHAVLAVRLLRMFRRAQFIADPALSSEAPSMEDPYAPG
jgi:hypothetical protein